MGARVGVVLCAVLAAACGGKVRGDPGLEGPSTQEGCESNPYGVCYPASDLGTLTMQLDAQDNVVAHGSRMPNFRFVGFGATSPAGVVDTSSSQILSLADFYDPDHRLGPSGQGLSVIHVMVNTMWCNPSNQEADLTSGANFMGENPGGTSWARELAPLGVVFLEVLTDGIVVSTPATLDDLRSWVTHHEVDYSVATAGGSLGSTSGALGIFFLADAIPFNIDIDARSMEILATSTGLDTSLDVHLKAWVAWESTHPPM